MAERIIDRAARRIDYRLNQLGIRVGPDCCQLISKHTNGWVPLGPRYQLPIIVPKNVDDLTRSWDSVRITAFQYFNECPNSDLPEVLAKHASFDEAVDTGQLEISFQSA